MKKYTKLMGILLALVMLVALMPMTALADKTPPDPAPDGSGTVVLPSPPITNMPTDKTKVEVDAGLTRPRNTNSISSITR